MSTPPARPLHPAAGWVAGVLAVILLYLVSFPTLYWSTLAKYHYEGSWRTALVDAYATPYYWLEWHGPLKTVLKEYDAWCASRDNEARLRRLPPPPP